MSATRASNGRGRRADGQHGRAIPASGTGDRDPGDSSMRFKTIIAATGLIAAFAVTAAPALAQAQPASGTPICANCHEQAHKSTQFTAHGARNDSEGTSCQACHVNASEHAKDPQKVKPAGALTSKT